VDYRPIPGVRRRADIVFLTARVAVFVDGCFWHGCPVHGTLPKKNREWWLAKLQGNRLRDEETDNTLREHGWLPLRFWEHDDSAIAAELVLSTVQGRAPALRRASTRAAGLTFPLGDASVRRICHEVPHRRLHREP
jgi:DNA mismatch endonuclease (patch repair protein)